MSGLSYIGITSGWCVVIYLMKSNENTIVDYIENYDIIQRYPRVFGVVSGVVGAYIGMGLGNYVGRYFGLP